jgi:hypothetical protein
MTACTEFAVFKVAPENMSRVIELSLAIFNEMNTPHTVITAHQILQNTTQPDELCWHLTWINKEVAGATTQQWPSFPSTQEFQTLVGKNLYYGHFVSAH